MCACRTTWIAGAAALLVTVSQGFAAINLELRAQPTECAEPIMEVDLYATVPAGEPNQSISAMDVVFSWDPGALELLGLDGTIAYPYVWQRSKFPTPDPFDINDTWDDGNALYQAFAKLAPSPPAYATQPGLWVTRFRFRKVMVDQAIPITIEETLSDAQTVVYDGEIPGLVVTGTLTGATVTPPATGDADCDGLISFLDITYFIAALAGEANWVDYHVAQTGNPPSCPFSNCDANCDGPVDFQDIVPFVGLLGG